MYPNDKLFKAKLGVLRSEVERIYQGRAIEHIGLYWSKKSRKYQSRVEQVDQIEVIRLYRLLLDCIELYHIIQY